MHRTHIMHTVKLIYNPEPRTQTLKETVTFCASLELYTQHGIESYQNSASTLMFTSSRDATLALIYLSNSGSFTPKYISNDEPCHTVANDTSYGA